MADVMTGANAIKLIVDQFDIPSLYALAKSLSDEELTIQPIQISNYMRGHRMSAKVAKRFLDVYNVVIGDVHNQGVFVRDKKNAK